MGGEQLVLGTRMERLEQAVGGLGAFECVGRLVDVPDASLNRPLAATHASGASLVPATTNLVECLQGLNAGTS